MEEPKASVVIIAPTVEEAISRGAAELGLPADQLEIEVLDEGTKGLLGLGSRQARIRVSVRGEEAQEAELRAPETAEIELEPAIAEADEDAETLRIARQTVVELLQRMEVKAEVSAEWGEPDEEGKVRPLLVDVHGDDLSIVIGRRGETLNALQYITRLIVGKELKKPVAVVIDVEGYKKRREQQLRRLARKVAEQTAEQSRMIALEPMPPHERRIIHIELREHPGVYTESVGEGDRRKVTIIPRK